MITCFSSVVTGPQFHKVHVGVGHRLDAFSSGVLGDKKFWTLNFSSDLIVECTLCSILTYLYLSFRRWERKWSAGASVQITCNSGKGYILYHIMINLTFNCYFIFYFACVFSTD